MQCPLWGSEKLGSLFIMTWLICGAFEFPRLISVLRALEGQRKGVKYNRRSDTCHLLLSSSKKYLEGGMDSSYRWETEVGGGKMTRAGSLRGQGRQDWDVFFFFFLVCITMISQNQLKNQDYPLLVYSDIPHPYLFSQTPAPGWSRSCYPCSPYHR